MTLKNTHNYEKYKASLHAIFDGKAPLPERVRTLAQEQHPTQADDACLIGNVVSASTNPEVLAARKNRRLPNGNAQKYTALLNHIRQAPPEDVQSKIDALLEAGFELPNDEEILSKSLTHKQEHVLEQGLQKLSSLLTQEKSKNPRLLKLRIENARLMASSSQIRELCDTVEQAIT